MRARNVVIGQKVSADKIARSKELRRGMTTAEAMLWQELRANKLGVHFRRQQIIAGFIVDFYCHAAGLVLEVDGAVHGLGGQPQSDAQREAVLSGMGLRVVRFRNDQIERDLPDTLARIRQLVRP